MKSEKTFSVEFACNWRRSDSQQLLWETIPMVSGETQEMCEQWIKAYKLSEIHYRVVSVVAEYPYK